MENITDIQDVQSQEPTQQDPPIKKLWSGLVNDGKYTKSFDDFAKQYNTPESISKLYKGLTEDGDYTKSIDDFKSQYFSDLKKKVGGAVIGANSGATPSDLETPYISEKETPQVDLNPPKGTGNGIDRREFGIMGDIFSDLKRGAKAMSIQESGNVQEDNTPQPPKKISTLSQLMPMVNPDLLQQPKAQAVSTLVSMNPPTDAIAKKKLELDRTRREQLMQDAVINTAENALRLKGINAPKGSPLWNEEVDKKKLAVLSGNATYHMDLKTGKPMLDKTANWLDDIGRGWNKAVEDEDEASNFINGMNTAQRAAYANERATRVQPDNPGEYLSVRHGVGELIGGAAPFMGKAIAGGVAGAALAALAPETGGATLAGLPAVMSFAFTAPSAIRGGMRDETLNRYYQLKRENPNMSDVNAMSKAEEGMISGGISSGLLNAALSDVGGGALTKAVSSEGKNVLKDFIGGTLKEGHKLGTATALATTGQSIETALEGYKTTPTDVIKKSIESYVDGAKTGMILHSFMTGIGVLPKAVNSALKYVLATEVPKSEIVNTLDANVKVGNITPEVADKTINDIDNFKASLEKTNPNLSPESKVSVAGLMQSRDNLVAEMEKLDKTQQAPYQTKIDAINNQIQKITETNKPLDYELDDVTGEPLSNRAEKVKGEITIPIKVDGNEMDVKYLDEYKGKKIVEVDGNIHIYDPKQETLFNVALDDSNGNGRIINQDANNIESAKKYIDWATKTREENIQPQTIKVTPTEVSGKDVVVDEATYNKDNSVDEEMPVMYHGTTEDKAASIKKDGFYKEHNVNITDDLSEAKEYAEMAAEDGEKPAIIKVRLKKNVKPKAEEGLDAMAYDAKDVVIDYSEIKPKEQSLKETPKAGSGGVVDEGVGGNSDFIEIHHGSGKGFKLKNTSIYLTEDKTEAALYAKNHSGKVYSYLLDKGKIADEDYIRDTIDEMGLKDNNGNIIDSNEYLLHELLDQRFDETAINVDDINKLYKKLKDDGYSAIDFADEGIGKKKNTTSILVFDTQSLKNLKEKLKEGSVGVGGERNPIIDSITNLDGSINKHFLKEAVIKAPVLLSVNEKSIGESIGYLRKIANEVNDTELTDTVQYLEDASKMVFAIKDLEGEKRNEFLSNSDNFWGTNKPPLERLKRLEDWSNVLKANTEKNKAERLLRDQYQQTLAEIKKRFVDEGRKPNRPKQIAEQSLKETPKEELPIENANTEPSAPIIEGQPEEISKPIELSTETLTLDNNGNEIPPTPLKLTEEELAQRNEIKNAIIKAGENKKSIKGKNDAMVEEADKYGEVGVSVLSEIKNGKAEPPNINIENGLTNEQDPEFTKIANAVNDSFIEGKFGSDALDKVVEKLQDTDLGKIYNEVKEKIKTGKIDPDVTRAKVIAQKSGDARDQAILLYDMAELKGREKEIMKEIIKSTDPKEQEQYQRLLTDVQNKMMDNTLANKSIGRDWHNIGKIRQQWVNKEFNLTDMRDEYMASKRLSELTKEQEKEIKDYHDKIKGLEVERENIKSELDKAVNENSKLKLENEELKKLKEKAINQKKKDRGKKSEDAIAKSNERIAKVKDDLKTLRDEDKSSGNIYSSIVPIPTINPKIALAISKIAAEKVYQGIVKIDELVKNILDDVKDVFPNWEEKDVLAHLLPNINTEKYFEAGKKYDESNKFLQDKINEYNKINKEFALTKFKWQQDRRIDIMEGRPFKERLLDGLLRWQRFAVLSYPMTVVKLATVVGHQAVLKPFKFAFQKAWAKILPESITSKQSLWGNPTIRSLGKYYSEMVRNFSLSNLKEQFGGIDTKEILYGKSNMYDEWAASKGLLEIPGRSHGYIKSFIKSPEFKYAQENIATHYIGKMKEISDQLKNNVLSEEEKTKLENEYGKWDITNPDVMDRVSKLSLDHARWGILMNDSKFVDKFRNFAKPDSPTGFLLRSEAPILKIPINYVGRSFATKYGLIRGILGKGRWEGKDTNYPGLIELAIKGTKDLKPEQADILGRVLTIGTMGAAFFTLGALNRKNVTINDDGSVDILGVHFSKLFTHSPELESFFNGVETANKEKDAKGAWEAIKAYAEGDIDIAKKSPFVNMLKYGFLPNLFSAMLDKDDRNVMKKGLDAVFKKVTDFFVPGLSKQIAGALDTGKSGLHPLDKPVNRKPDPQASDWDRAIQTLELTIPGLRQNVPTIKYGGKKSGFGKSFSKKQN